MNPRAVGALAVAGFRDRVRRQGFAMAAVATLALGYLAAPPPTAGYTMVRIGAYRGVYDSAYLGVLFALVGALWLSLAGFYVVKDAVGRDATTGVGAVLAATPLRTAGYLFGTFLGNLLALATLAGVLALSAPVMQVLRGESLTIDPLALMLPFVVLCVPLLAVSAAGAVLFEATPGLRGALGNVVWFFAFLFVFATVMGSGGLDAIGDSMRADLVAEHPGVSDTDIAVGLTTDEDRLGRFTWSGLRVGAGLAVRQLGALALAVAMALLAAPWFHRFDPARRRTAGPPDPAVSTTALVATVAAHARPTVPVEHSPSMVALITAEARVLLAGTPPWWWLGLGGITLAALAAPGGGGGTVLLVAWIWPLLVWSRLGTHGVEHGVHQLLDASAGGHRRLFAAWGAGLAITALAGAGPLVRMVLAGDGSGVAAWSAAAVLIPTLALLLGVVSRTPRLFQLVYLALWYTVLNGLAVFDVMGALRDQGQLAGPPPAAGLAITVVLLALTVVQQQVRHAHR